MIDLQPLEILYCDDHLVAVNKPAGLLVHRTSIAEEQEHFVLQRLRDQLGRRVYPIHRLDRPTSGVLLMAFSGEVAASVQASFLTSFHKEYLALVRGWMPESIDLDHPVRSERGNLQNAHTRFESLQTLEFPFATDRYATARYSVVRCLPTTGRWHQLRQHLAHLRHYIINDRVHGDGKQNRLFDRHLGLRDMFLHAHRLTFDHPVTSARIVLVAPLPDHWHHLPASCDSF